MNVRLVRCRDFQFPWQIWDYTRMKTVDGGPNYYISGHRTEEQARRSAKRNGYTIKECVTEDAALNNA